MRGLFLLNDYAPFGSLLKSWTNPTVSAGSRTKFLEKEKDAESGDCNLGVRQYGDAVGRFFCPDKMWEKYYSLSPYVYCGNNAVGASDPSGLSEILHDYSTFVGPPTLDEMKDNPEYFNHPEIQIPTKNDQNNSSGPLNLSSSSRAINPIFSGSTTNTSDKEVETSVSTASNAITAGQAVGLLTGKFANGVSGLFTGLSEIYTIKNFTLPAGDPNKISTNEFIYNTVINTTTVFGRQEGAVLGLWYGPIFQSYGNYYSQHSEEQKNGAMNTQLFMMQMGIPWSFY
ncbi:MAG: hypothetical protein NT007_02810 [Candidatus Kapabacteria bacterium]|nr:hypothetical protein [Candidatus Kapabacteria bacterium]